MLGQPREADSLASRSCGCNWQLQYSVDLGVLCVLCVDLLPFRLKGGGRPVDLDRVRQEEFPWTAESVYLIGFAVMGFNLLGDALREAWDPKLRQR